MWMVVWLVLVNGNPMIVTDNEFVWSEKAKCEERLDSETPVFIKVMNTLAARNKAEITFVRASCIDPEDLKGLPA